MDFLSRLIEIDHFSGHAAIDNEILAGDESRTGIGQEKYELGHIRRLTDPADGLLEVLGGA
jgi:hypothetical protein